MDFLRKYSGYIGFGLLLGGMIVGGIGWDKFDSTLPVRTQGSVFMLVVGCAMIVAGLLTIKLNTNREQ